MIVGLQNAIRSFQDDQESPRCPKARPEAIQEEPKREQKREPIPQDEIGPNPDDPKTVLDRPRADLPSSAAPPGLGAQHATNRSQNDQESKRTSKTLKKQSEMIKDSSWSDLGSILAASWGSCWPKSIGKRDMSLTNHFFDDKTIRRRFRGPLGTRKAPT